MSTVAVDDVVVAQSDTNSKETANVDKISEGNGMRQCSSQQCRGPMFTAVEDLLVM